MDFKDAAARFKQKKEAEAAARQERPMDFGELYRLRGKMLGVLLRDARINTARDIEECAHHLRVSAEEYETWEYGDAVPTLPQLELIAHFLDVPVSHFWGMETFESIQEDHEGFHAEYLNLRNRMIGVMLRQAREEAGIPLETLSAGCGLPSELIAAYELGEIPLPMHELAVLAAGVNKNVSYFLETSDHIGKWLATLEDWKRFTELSAEMREFVANPRHLGYLEIALAFSKMPVETQREIGTAMLEITM